MLLLNTPQRFGPGPAGGSPPARPSGIGGREGDSARDSAKKARHHPNRFFPTLRSQWAALLSLKFPPPWVPDVIQAIVLVVILIILTILALTIGVCNQIWETLFTVAEDQGEEARRESHSIARAAHLVTAGVFCVAGAPFFAIAAPFEAVGLGWARLRGKGDVDPALWARLAGTGALAVGWTGVRLGWFPLLWQGIVFLWVAITGLGHHDATPLLNNST